MNQANSSNNNNNNNDEKYKKFFYNSENLENIYNILKGEDKQLKKETVKRLIQDFEGVEYDDIKDDNKNVSNNISEVKSSSKIITVNKDKNKDKDKDSKDKDSKDKDSSSNNNNSDNSKDNHNISGTSETEDKSSNNDYISFEEFCNIFKEIYESAQNPNKIFLEGFCYMDKDK